MKLAKMIPAPAGSKRKVDFCQGGPCQLRGSAEVGFVLSEFSNLDITHWECLGNCQNGPNAYVDGELYERLTPEKLRTIVRG